MIPANVRRFLWDTNTKSFDPTACPAYTIARILEYEDEKAVAWLREAFAEDEIERPLSP
jgi:hypothetical protein